MTSTPFYYSFSEDFEYEQGSIHFTAFSLNLLWYQHLWFLEERKYCEELHPRLWLPPWRRKWLEQSISNLRVSSSICFDNSRKELVDVLATIGSWYHLKFVWLENSTTFPAIVDKSSTLLASCAGAKIDCTLGGNLEKSSFFKSRISDKETSHNSLSFLKNSAG